MRKAFALILCAAIPAGSVDLSTTTATSTTITNSTATWKPRSTYPRKPPPKQIKDMVPKPIRQVPHRIQQEIKRTKPNPNVQKPGPAPMPTQAPAMPEGPTPDTEPLPGGANKFFDVVARYMTTTWSGNIFVWLPAISTDPNTGPTYGILPVLVLADPEDKHIRHLMAPSVTYNELFGTTGTMRYYWYPTDDSQMFALASFSKDTNREVKLRYENPSLYDKVIYVRGEMLHAINGSRRFFGIGPNTHDSQEAGFTFRETGARATVGVNFLSHMRAAFGMRFMTQQTRRNIIPETRDLIDLYPGVTGIELQQTVTHELRLLWDSRDLPVTPSQGTSAEVFVEKTSKPWGSDANYFRHGLEAKQFFPWANKRQNTVVRGFYERVLGSNVPFYEQAQLGGRETLRGFGDGRFVDTGRIGTSVEQRYTIAAVKLMGIETNFELAPFVDIGTVFPHLSDIQRKDFLLVGGIGFRAAVKPNVVGDVELGFGKEGPAVFVDINYPF